MPSPYDFLDGFADRSFANVMKKVWTTQPGGHNFLTDGRVPSTTKAYNRTDNFGSIQVDYGGSVVPGSSGFTARAGFGAAFKFTGNDLSSRRLFQTDGITNNRVTVYLESGPDGRLYLQPSATPTDVSITMYMESWFFIELDLTFHEADGIFTFDHTVDIIVYIEGRQVLNQSGIVVAAYSGGQQFLNPSIISFGGVGGNMLISDFYFRTAGAFGCAARVFTLHPTGDGTYSEWGATPQYTKVDETLLDVSDFVITTAKDVRETFVLDDLPASVPSGRNIKMCQYSAYLEGSQTDDVWVYPLLDRSGLFEGGVDNKMTSGKYNLLVLTDDPFSASQITAAELNATDGGMVTRDLKI